MKEKWELHIIAVSAFVIFIALGLACASTPKIPSVEIVYTKVPFSELHERIENVYQTNSPGKGFIVEAFIGQTDDNTFSVASDRRNLFTGSSMQFIGISHKKEGSNYILLRWNEIPYEDFNFFVPYQFEQYDRETYKRIDRNKMYVIYLGSYYLRFSDGSGRWITKVDKIEGLISSEEITAIEAQQRADREAAEKARAAQEEARQQAEQTRLANLYRQAGNNFGNLRNTSKRYGRTFGNDYITTIYNFGDGNYIEQTESALGFGIFGSSFGTKTGTYRVNGDTVIFLSSEGKYSYGTIVGTALNINGDIYR